MKKWLVLIVAVAATVWAMAPHAAYTEDRNTVLLARTVYALARNESYETQLAIANVAVNRLASPWFSDDLDEVLSEQHQFPAGSRYDAQSLSAAHDVLSGRRVLSPEAVYYQSAAATQPREDLPLEAVGGFRFYATGTGL